MKRIRRRSESAATTHGSPAFVKKRTGLSRGCAAPARELFGGTQVVIPGRRAAAIPESIFQRPVFMASGPRPPDDPGMTDVGLALRCVGRLLPVQGQNPVAHLPAVDPL